MLTWCRRDQAPEQARRQALPQSEGHWIGSAVHSCKRLLKEALGHVAVAPGLVGGHCEMRGVARLGLCLVHCASGHVQHIPHLPYHGGVHISFLDESTSL